MNTDSPTAMLLAKLIAAIRSGPPSIIGCDNNQDVFNFGWNSAMNMVFNAGGPELAELVKKIDEEMEKL